MTICELETFRATIAELFNAKAKAQHLIKTATAHELKTFQTAIAKLLNAKSDEKGRQEMAYRPRTTTEDRKRWKEHFGTKESAITLLTDDLISCEAALAEEQQKSTALEQAMRELIASEVRARQPGYASDVLHAMEERDYFETKALALLNSLDKDTK